MDSGSVFLTRDDLPSLVTGGCGFIGSHIVDALLSKRYTVSILDGLSAGEVSNIAKLAAEDYRGVFAKVYGCYFC